MARVWHHRRLEVRHQPDLAGLLDWQVAGLCALGQFWRHRRPHAQRIGRAAGHPGRIGTKPRRTHRAFCGCAVWNTQRSDRLCLPMSAQRNLSHDMETYSSDTRVRGYACEHTRICAAPQTRLLPRWVSLLFESVRAGRWHAHPLGSMEPLMSLAEAQRPRRRLPARMSAASLAPPSRRLFNAGLTA